LLAWGTFLPNLVKKKTKKSCIRQQTALSDERQEDWQVDFSPAAVGPAFTRPTLGAPIRLLLLDPCAAALNEYNQHDHKQNTSGNPHDHRAIH